MQLSWTIKEDKIELFNWEILGEKDNLKENGAIMIQTGKEFLLRKNKE